MVIYHVLDEIIPLWFTLIPLIYLVYCLSALALICLYILLACFFPSLHSIDNFFLSEPFSIQPPDDFLQVVLVMLFGSLLLKSQALICKDSQELSLVEPCLSIFKLVIRKKELEFNSNFYLWECLTKISSLSTRDKVVKN